jgi:hypothetical protein
MVNNSTNISKHHLSLQLIEWWSTIQWVEVICDFVDISGIVDHHSMSWSGRWFLLILVELLTITHNINKNHLSPQYIEWWSTIPPISTKITSHLITLSDGQQFHQYQQKSPLNITHWVIYWWNCWPSLNELSWEVFFVDIGGIVDHHSMWLGERWFLLILVELLTIT